MVTKAMFQAFALPGPDGNYFLRPDRLLGAFFLPASQQPVGYFEAKDAMAAEKAADTATKERLGSVQREMEASGDALRALHLELHGEHGAAGGAGDSTLSLAASAPALVADAADHTAAVRAGGGEGDIELATLGGDDDGGGGVGLEADKRLVRSPMANLQWGGEVEEALASAGGLGDLVALSETGSGGGGCTLGGDNSSDEENKEDEMEKSRLNSRLHAAQQFRGSKVLTTNGCTSTIGRRSLGVGGGGGVNEFKSGVAADIGGEKKGQESEWGGIGSGGDSRRGSESERGSGRRSGGWRGASC
jgi:hypothetical protein